MMQLADLKFTQQGPVVTSAEITQAEQRMKMQFPEDYRAFLLKFNGGRSQICLSTEPFLAMEFWKSVTEKIQLPITSLQLALENTMDQMQGEFFILGSSMGQEYVLMKARAPGQFGIHVWSGDTFFDRAKSKPLFPSFTAMITAFRHADYEEYERIVLG